MFIIFIESIYLLCFSWYSGLENTAHGCCETDVSPHAEIPLAGYV